MEITLLKEEQIFGEDRLKIFEEYGVKAPITDFAILLGGFVNNCYYYNNSNSLEDRTGYYWTSSDTNDCTSVSDNGSISYNLVYGRVSGVRPTLPYSLICNISSSIVKVKDDILELEYGEYPQYIVSKNFSRILEDLYCKNNLNKTGKVYITDSPEVNSEFVPFEARKHTEYVYKGKKYIRFIGDNNYYGKRLSDGRTFEEGKAYWVEVSPIKWLVDKEKDIALSERILFAGVQFNPERNYKGNFKETFMYKYLNNIFIKDIQVQPKEIEISVIEEKSEKELALEKLDKDKQKILSLKNRLIK